jgi:hypothetical protein
MGSCQERVGKTRLIAAQFQSDDDDSIRITSSELKISPGTIQLTVLERFCTQVLRSD